MEATEGHDSDSFSLSLQGSSATGRVEPGSTSGSHPTEDNPAAQEKKYDDDDEDDDDYVAELTRQMANYMLQDDDKHQKCSWGGSGSPQSTLWSPFGFGSVSPIGPSREPSPPLTPASEKMNPFPSKQALIDDQIRSAQASFRKVREDGEKEKREQRSRNDVVYGSSRGRATTRRYAATSTAYGGNYQRNGSGMKAVFLDGSGPRSGSGGTGVFLPRGTATGTVLESRKKTGSSRVIIPARVVEALKHHFDKMGMPSKLSCEIPPHHDALVIAMKNQSKKKTQQRGQSPDLPPEWTY